MEGESDDSSSFGEETWRTAASSLLVFVSFSVVFTIPMFLCWFPVLESIWQRDSITILTYERLLIVTLTSRYNRIFEYVCACTRLAIQLEYLLTTVSLLTTRPRMSFLHIWHRRSSHAETAKFALLLPPFGSYYIAGLPPHLGASALTSVDSIQTDLLRDAVCLVRS